MKDSRVRRSLDHVLQFWLPVNAEAFAHIKGGLSDGRYDSSPDTLLRDLKADLSLYLWCLRRSSERKRDQAESGLDFDPILLLEQSTVEDFKEILDVPLEEISTHALSSAHSSQVKLLQDILLGAAAAETASEASKGDSRAFGATLLKQLGLTLIAWNYESVFNEIVRSLNDCSEIEEKIAERLGFTPELLGTVVVQSWGVSSEKCYSLGLRINPETEKHEEIKPRDEEQKFLWEVIELGQKFAQANDPERYPKARADWKKVDESLRSTIGSNFMSKIRSRFEEYCLFYVRQIPAILTGKGRLFDRKNYPSELDKTRIIQQNPFLFKCEPELQLPLKILYRKVTAGESQEALVRFFFKETLPSIGFTGASVYIFDPLLNKLLPQLRIGELELLVPKSVTPSMRVEDDDLITSTFQRSTPLQHSGLGKSGGMFLGSAATIGKIRKTGVLYLEIPSTRNRFGADVNLVHTQALARALCDTLTK